MDVIDVILALIVAVAWLAGSLVKITLNVMTGGIFEFYFVTRWAWELWWVALPIAWAVYLCDRRATVRMRNAALKRGWKTVIMAEK